MVFKGKRRTHLGGEEEREDCKKVQKGLERELWRLKGTERGIEKRPPQCFGEAIKGNASQVGKKTTKARARHVKGLGHIKRWEGN